MTSLLVANRGEIVLRVFRTARPMGLRCVAVYSDADAGAPHVRAADAAVRIGPAPAAESYLRVDAIVEAAQRAGAELVHPGYGFLAEDAELAEACAKAGLIFVGPPPEVLRAMGAKDEAKRVAVAAGAPVLPGYDGADQSGAALRRAAGEIGYPLIVKPIAGGGGKGMAVVRTADDLEPAIASARRLAASAFGDDRVLLERYLDDPRHVEVQILADAYGTVVHLGERDCSVQRRHQKIFEETPSPALGHDQRERIGAAAVAIARHAGYVNAGTCEFLVHQDDVGFMEMNARLQVEHPVTEMVTGLDLVELQLRVAMGERLPFAQEDVTFRGHAIQARLYAEDPDEGFLPQAGVVRHLRWPPGVRVDAGVEEGSRVTTFYDPMLAKLIVWGENREAALERLRQALDSTEVLGPRTNLGLLRAVAGDDAFTGGEVSTTWLERAYAGWRGRGQDTPQAAALAAAAQARQHLTARDPDPWARLGPWRASGDGAVTVVLRPDDVERVYAVRGSGPWTVDGFHVAETGEPHGWTVDGRPAAAVRDADRWLVWWASRQYEVPSGPRQRRLEAAGAAHLGAPLPGQVIAVKVAAGERVSRGAELVVVEAMKMEHAVLAPADGVVIAVLCSVGQQVERGQTLVDFEAGEP